MEVAFSLEGVFVFVVVFLLFVRLLAGAVGFGFYGFGSFGVFGVYELVLGGGVLAETSAGRSEHYLSWLRRPGYVGGAVARPP